MRRIGLLLLLAVGVARAQEQKLSILQGATDARSTQLSIVVPRDTAFKLALKPADGGLVVTPARTETVTNGASPWAVLKARFFGLEPGLDYELFVIGPGVKVWDKRTLRAFDPDRKEGVVAVASCMDDFYKAEQKAMWTALLSVKPDLVFLIGDNVYADRRAGQQIPLTADVLWDRYVEVRRALALFQAATLVPILATWDDHDYGINNGGRGFPLKERSAEIFSTFFAQAPVHGFLARGPGVATTFKAFGLRFLLMDGRTFRSPNRQPVADETHWGATQEAWLFAHLGDAATPAWIVNGDQIFGGYQRFESYEGSHPNSFLAFLARMKEAASPVAFLTGDRHLAEVMEIEAELFGYKTYEITTSAIHARTFPDAWRNQPNRRKLAGASGVLNYAIMRTGADGGLACAVTVYGPEKKVLVERKLKVAR